MPRLRTDIFVSALLRQVATKGGMGAIVAKGFAEAGAVHVEWRWRGAVGLLVPAPQTEQDEDGGRLFTPVQGVTDEAAIGERIARERRFDADAWHVEIEGVDPRTVLAIIE